jgi:hypothetical protein
MTATFDRADYLRSLPLVPLCIAVTLICRWWSERAQRREREAR